MHLTARDDPHLATGFGGGLNFEHEIGAPSGADVYSNHVLVVVLLNRIFGGWRIVGGSVVEWVLRLGKKVGHQIVQNSPILPITTQARSVVALQTRNPPGYTRWNHFGIRRVLVDDNWSMREIVGIQ